MAPHVPDTSMFAESTTPAVDAAMTDLVEFLQKSRGRKWGEAEEEEAQTTIDFLDESISSLSADHKVYARAVRRLQVLCRQAGRLPSSCLISKEVVLEVPGEPHCQSNFSDVYRGRLGRTPVALKALRVHIDSKAKVEKAFYSEAVMWRSLRHPNVVPFLGVSMMIAVCLVSVWMPNGTVTAYLLANPDADRVALLRNIVDGLQYVHSLGVVHGDMKAANILINGDFQACLADFGLATALHASATMTGTSSLRGTLRWMAPELVDSEVDGGLPTVASDVYATAMVFYEVFSGQYPYHELRHDAAVMRRILGGVHPERPANASDHGLTDIIWSAMVKCWAADPAQRGSLGYVAECIGEEQDSIERQPYAESLDTSSRWDTGASTELSSVVELLSLDSYDESVQMPPAPSNPAWAPQSWDRPSPQEEQPATPTDTALLERGITHEDAAPSVNIIDDPDPSAPDLIRAAASLLGRLFEQWDPPGAHGRTGSIQHHMSEHLARRVHFVLLSEFGKGAGLSEFRQALEDGYILCQYLMWVRDNSPLCQPDHNEAQYSISLFLEQCRQMGVHEDNLFRPGDLARSATAEELGRVAWTVLILHRIFIPTGLEIHSPPWKSSPPLTSHISITPSSAPDKDGSAFPPRIINDGLTSWPTPFPMASSSTPSLLHAGKFLADSSRALGGRISPALSTITIPQDVVKKRPTAASDSLMNVLKHDPTWRNPYPVHTPAFVPNPPSSRDIKQRRIVVLGSRSVGKSSLVLQYIDNHFVESYYPTIETTLRKRMNYKGTDYECDIIDTAGQDEYSILSSKHAIGAHGFILVYAVTSRASFDICQIIHNNILNFSGLAEVPCVIVGAKADLSPLREVSQREGTAMAKNNHAAFIETSAKWNDNVAKVFELCFGEIERRQPNHNSEPMLNKCLIM